MVNLLSDSIDGSFYRRNASGTPMPVLPGGPDPRLGATALSGLAHQMPFYQTQTAPGQPDRPDMRAYLERPDVAAQHQNTWQTSNPWPGLQEPLKYHGQEQGFRVRQDFNGNAWPEQGPAGTEHEYNQPRSAFRDYSGASIR